MDDNIAKIQKELIEQKETLSKIYDSTEKTRKYFLWMLIASVALFILPLIIFLIVLPGFLNQIIP